MKKLEQETEPKKMYAAILSNSDASICQVDYDEKEVNNKRWWYIGDGEYIRRFKTKKEALRGIRNRFASLKLEIEESISKLESGESSKEEINNNDKFRARNTRSYSR